MLRKRFTRSRTRRQRGTEAVEFAMLFPIFAAIVLGVTDFGWLAYHKASVHSAVHMGCRQGSLIDPGFGESQLPAVVAATHTALTTQYDLEGPGCNGACSTTVAAVGTNPGRSLACQLDVNWVPLTGYAIGPKTLSANAIVRLEYQR